MSFPLYARGALFHAWPALRTSTSHRWSSVRGRIGWDSIRRMRKYRFAATPYPSLVLVTIEYLLRPITPVGLL
jgi:hypothetical protein